MLYVKKQTLLFIAFLVWGIAGFNVLRIGFFAYPNHLSFVNLFLSFIVFLCFQKFVFGKLVKKHTKRIMEYKEAKQFFLKFFDTKSFLIMAFMMTGGIWLRSSEIVSEKFIAIFYSGLGASLFLAGILFGIQYINAGSNKNKNQEITK